METANKNQKLIKNSSDIIVKIIKYQLCGNTYTVHHQLGPSMVAMYDILQALEQFSMTVTL